MLYLIGCGKYVKIGVSARPWERLAEFQTGNPEPLEMLAIGPGDHAFESELHRLFGEYRGVGEWFQDNERIRAVVAFMRDTFPELQEPPRLSMSFVRSSRDEQPTDEWRVETRTYTKKDGSTSTYRNYRRRKVEHDPETGKRRVEYRAGGSIDELPRGDRYDCDLPEMENSEWRIEVVTNRNGRRFWQWRRRGPVRDSRYGGRLLDDAPPLPTTPAPAVAEEAAP